MWWAEKWPAKDIYVLITVKIGLNGKKGLCKCDEVKYLEMGRLYAFSRWALNAITTILIQGRLMKTLPKKKRQCGHGGSNRSDAATCQQMPAAIRSWKARGMDSPLEPQKGEQPHWLLDSSPVRLTDVRKCERINFCYVSHQVCGNLLRQPWENASDVA